MYCARSVRWRSVTAAQRPPDVSDLLEPVPATGRTSRRRGTGETFPGTAGPSGLLLRCRPDLQRLSLPTVLIAARPASSRATGIRYGEQDT